MNRQTLDGVVKTASMEWTPLDERGVDTRGISVKALRADPVTGRAPTFVLRFEPGATYPYHNHPAGEELFVLSGSCVIDSSAPSSPRQEHSSGRVLVTVACGG